MHDVGSVSAAMQLWWSKIDEMSELPEFSIFVREFKGIGSIGTNFVVVNCRLIKMLLQ